jgi:hypothetical protein
MTTSIDNAVERTSYGSRKSAGKVLVAAAALLMTAGAANATTVTGSYTVGYTPINGGTLSAPAITDNLAASFSVNPTLNGSATSPTNFFTVNPSSSCHNCGSSNTASGTLTITFTFTNMTPVPGSDLTETALYQAKYSGSALGCAAASGSGQTDCVTWQGTDGINTLSTFLVVNFTNGDSLKITFYDAEDWAITPKISFQLTDPGTTPLPGALPLFVSGSGLLGLIGLRRKKQMAKKAAV